MAFRLEQYMDRIGLADVPSGAAGLASVQEAHMRAIPFENIDPLLGRVPSLAPDDLVAKLVAGGRGGYCFEHNALFGLALTALGFAPVAVLARVFAPSGLTGARSHHAFLVETEGEVWLADTGFGGHGALAPVRLGTAAAQPAPNGRYRVRVDPMSGETALEREAGGNWIPQYAFDRAPVHAIDFEAANFLCARWAEAPFSANLMVAFHADQGRIALFNRGLTRGLPPDARLEEIANAEELGEVLRAGCGLSLDRREIARIWARIKHAPTRR